MEEVDTELMAADPEHLDQLIKERRLQQLKCAVADLPPRAKEALMLAKYREMTLKEVAREMEISQTMVEKHLKTALQKCRTALISESH
ncbi:sigma-70 family RNA polymerase sigma factor [Aliamphritea spongicola]|nr:sigma-70 family RNA polymerase sigma factor [Aliamphritea spongicola]